MKKTHRTWIILSILLFIMLSTMLLQTTNAQTSSQYWVIVNRATSNDVLYSTIRHNLTLTFKAVWSYGQNSGKAIDNASVTIEVKSSQDAVIDTLISTANETGFISFNYSVQNPDLLTFTPTKLVTSDGIEWNSTLLQAESNLYGVWSESIVVYYDTFNVALLSSDTSTQGKTSIIVNVTYLLVPEEGLTLPPSSSYLNQTFFPKIAHGVDVTINGVAAQESSQPGVYSTDFPTMLPTTYVLVEVSQTEWATKHKAFSFPHSANASLWIPVAEIAAIVFTLFSVTGLFFALRKKSVVNLRSLPIVGGILLMASSFVSLYLGIVGVDSTLHRFNWIFLSIFGSFSFSVGLLGSVLSWKRKNQALVLYIICLSMFSNVAIVKISIDTYQLPMPWLMIVLSFVLSLVSGLLIGNSDKQFRASTENGLEK